MSNPFAAKIQTNSPTFTLSVTALVLGLMLGFAAVTNQERQRVGRELPNEIRYGAIDLQKNYIELQGEVNRLRAQVSSFEKATAQENEESKLIQESLEKYKVAAGLTELRGPGITVVLRDSKRDDLLPGGNIIHDVDLLRVINDLWAAGAEAIAINGQRLVGSSPIRCVGPSVQINYVPTAAPITIQALGESIELERGMALPGGPIEELIQTDPTMVSIERVDKMTLPAFNGALRIKLGEVPEEVAE